MAEARMWAICDTDGGRHPPKPLARYIYTLEQEAVQARQYRGMDAGHYPVMAVTVRLERAD
jgi:hypothetical protein